jgi:hypothetical protein
MVSRQHNWGQDRVFYYDLDGRLKSFAANITDLLPVDVFTRISAARSAFRVEDLLELRALLDRHGGPAGGHQDV